MSRPRKTARSVTGAYDLCRRDGCRMRGTGADSPMTRKARASLHAATGGNRRRLMICTPPTAVMIAPGFHKKTACLFDGIRNALMARPVNLETVCAGCRRHLGRAEPPIDLIDNRKCCNAASPMSKNTQEARVSSGTRAVFKKLSMLVLPMFNKRCRRVRSIQVVNRHFTRPDGVHVEAITSNGAQRIKASHWKSAIECNSASHEFQPELLQTQQSKTKKWHISRDPKCESRILQAVRDTLTIKSTGKRAGPDGAARRFEVLNLHCAQNDQVISHSPVLRPVECETDESNAREQSDSFHICILDDHNMKECGARGKTPCLVQNIAGAGQTYPLPHSCACAPAARPVRAKQAHTPNTKGHLYATRWNTAPEAVVDFHLQIRDGRHHRHPPAAGAHVHAQHHPVRRSVHLSRPKHLPTHTHAHPGGPRKQARAMTTRPRRRGGGRMRGRGADSPMTRQGAFALHARLSEPGGRR